MEKGPKRTRQACEPCRRKKSKCSGGRPICSTCDRLRQQCFYASEPTQALNDEHDDSATPLNSRMSFSPRRELPRAQRWEDRIESLESTMKEVLNTLRAERGCPLNTENYVSHTLPEAIVAHASPDVGQLHHSDLPPLDQMLEVADLYLKYCDCQPLPLFDPSFFKRTLHNRDPEVLYCIMALATRFSKDNYSGENDASRTTKFARLARTLAMRRITDGKIELSTLQTLCMLTLIDQAHGNTEMARVHSTLAMTLAHCAQLYREVHLSSERPDLEERRRCYWSITLLRRLFGDHTPVPNRQARLPPFPMSAMSTPETVISPEARHDLPRRFSSEAGIMTLVLRLSEVWSRAIVYLRNREPFNKSSSPWAPQSLYSQTMTSLMDLSQHLSPLHRYRSLRLKSLSTDDLNRSREYWAPWFLSRFIYHTIICILNHPLLVMLQLQGAFEPPEIFLQQTKSYTLHHTTWILQYIEFLRSRNFHITDPVLGYCAAVVATIELQLSFSDDKSLSQSKRDNFKSCLDFIQIQAQDWQHMRCLSDKLQRLAESLAVSHESSLSKAGDQAVPIDLFQFFQILDFGTFARSNGLSVHQDNMFGSTLSLDRVGDGARHIHLARLPPITQIDLSPHTADTPMSETHVLPTMNTPGRTGQPSISQACRTDYAPDLISNDFMLPADQFFGRHSHQTFANWWDLEQIDMNMTEGFPGLDLQGAVD